MPIDPSVDPLFDAAGKQYNVDPDVLRALHLAETGGTGRWDQTSPAGAQGGMQFIPGTAARYGVQNPFDPQQAIPGAAHYLSDLLGDAEQQVGPGPDALTMALRNYNAGSPGHWNNPETAAYAGTVARYYGSLKPQVPEKPMNGVDQLAAAGQPAPAQPQLAEAGSMSDDDLLQGFINGTLPFMPKPGGAVPASTAPTMTASGPSASSAPVMAAQAPGALAMPRVEYADPTNAMYSPEQLRIMSVTPALAGPAAGILKMQESGIQINHDGTQSVIRGGAKDPANAYATSTATKLGENQEQIGPGGQIIPQAGALPASEAAAQAKAEGEQGPVRQTQAVAPQPFRGAGSGVFYPPGSPAVPNISSAAQSGQTPEGTAIRHTGNGGVVVENTNPSSETIGKNFETLEKMEETANASRTQLYQAQLLKDRLSQIGTSGPATQALGALSAWAQQAGVPPETLKKFQIPDGATVEQANSLALGLLGEGLRATFPQRITNTDISTFRPSSPNVNMLDEASKFLIDKFVVPKAARDVERYGYATSLPQNDPQDFKAKLFQWDQANPYSKYVQQPNAAVNHPDPAAVKQEMIRRGLLKQ